MELKMRPLKTGDVFMMSKILKKMNLKIDVKGKSQEQFGAEFVLKLGENLHLAEKEVNEFLGGLVGLKGEEFASLPLEESLEVMKQFKEQPAAANFFKAAADLTK